MKVLLTGARGQLGYELERTLACLGQVTACERSTLDLADPTSIRRAVRRITPHLIVNAGAYTAVDQAESEPDLAMAINGVAPGILAEEAKRIGASIIHYSTDYVFDGEKDSPYTEDDLPNPCNEYGRSKLAGERAVASTGVPYFIFRTSWIYGLRGRNFMRTMRRLAAQNVPLRVVDDQNGAPTWCRLVAEATALAIAKAGRQFTDRAGLYHLTCAGAASWYEFAQRVLQDVRDPNTGCAPEIVPVATSCYATAARRPRNSLLCCAAATERLGIALPHWQDALMLCLAQEATTTG